jgi:hypothetical protein
MRPEVTPSKRRKERGSNSREEEEGGDVHKIITLVAWLDPTGFCRPVYNREKEQADQRI